MSSYNWLKYILFRCVSLYNCNNVPVTCTEPSFSITTYNEPVLGNDASLNSQLNFTINFVISEYDNFLHLPCYDYYYHENCQCKYILLHAYIDEANKQLDWIYGLKICISINSSKYVCHNISKANCEYYPNDDRCYQVNKCFNDYIDIGPVEVLLYVQTIDIINISTSRNVHVMAKCTSDSGDCRKLMFVI